MKKNRHRMIRFRIFGIFHKHFVWRLLNYNPEREREKKKNSVKLTIESDLFTSIFLYNTYIYIYTYKTAHTKYVSTKYSLYNLNIIWTERYLHTFYICTKIGIFTWRRLQWNGTVWYTQKDFGIVPF